MFLIERYCTEGMKRMNTFKVFLKNGSSVTINAKHVKITAGNTVFYNDRKSLADQYINGPEIVANFTKDDYSYFIKD